MASILRVKVNGQWADIPAIQGKAGPQGKSAYDLAKENGFEGSETEWLESLQGISPEIIDGYWWIGDYNTGVAVTATPDFVALEKDEIEKICK